MGRTRTRVEPKADGQSARHRVNWSTQGVDGARKADRLRADLPSRHAGAQRERLTEPDAVEEVQRVAAAADVDEIEAMPDCRQGQQTGGVANGRQGDGPVRLRRGIRRRRVAVVAGTLRRPGRLWCRRRLGVFRGLIAAAQPASRLLRGTSLPECASLQQAAPPRRQRQKEAAQESQDAHRHGIHVREIPTNHFHPIAARSRPSTCLLRGDPKELGWRISAGDMDCTL
jgi:hypothetical protein